MALLLGIDIGTSGAKTLLIDTRGRVVASASAEYPCLAPRPAWSEQEPRHWVDAARKTVRAVMRRAAGGRVLAVGLSGQMHGAVFLDAAGDVLRPAILWNDQRTAAECDEITRLAGGRRRLLRMVANPALTGFTAPKILWVRRHEPRLWDRTVKVLLPKDYLRYRLTGEFATDASDASGTLLLDVRRRAWCRPLLSRLQIDPDLMPRCYESPEVTGVLSAAGARLLGLEPGIPVVAGGGDNAAGAVGNGVVRRGVVSASLGTSGVVFAHADAMETDPEGRVHTFCTAVPGKWHVMGVVLAAGGSLQWYRNVLCEAQAAEARRRRVDPYDLITADAAAAPVGSHGLYFLPYLTGERTPHADPNARGCWVGLSNMHRRGELARSVMEGITYAMRDSLEIIRGMGVPVKEIRATGGGARSAFWRQMQADVYGQAVCTINAAEGPAYGAALLAGVGAGVWADVPEASDAVVRVGAATRPDRRRAAAYNRRYPQFQALYRSLRDDFARMAVLELDAHGA
ncbi:MAG: xylulokinase [Phycisphaerae bacterium]|nr:xylulokinase [Phycisphaerae bacterium]